MTHISKHSLIDRLRARRPARFTHVGVAWYTEEEWLRVKASATDPDRLEPAYAAWHAMAVEALGDLKRVGVDPVPCLVTAAELLAWCRLNGRPNNGAARAEFVSHKLHDRGGGDAPGAQPAH